MVLCLIKAMDFSFYRNFTLTESNQDKNYLEYLI
jgi:hypothetical protein